MKKIFIRTNDEFASKTTAKELRLALEENGFEIQDEFSFTTELVISIGGDGTFLRTLKTIQFAPVPVLGINTGHLGFYSEFMPNELDKIIEACKYESFDIQTHRTIRTNVETGSQNIDLDPALNDVLIKHWSSSLLHLDVYIGDSFIESFSGDGLLISSPAGSTAYNYALGGSIIDPRLNLLQLTPMAPINNSIYRNFTSSLLAPENEKIVITTTDTHDAMVIVDGNNNSFANIKKITISLSNQEVKIVRLPGYDFWGKVKSKFL